MQEQTSGTTSGITNEARTPLHWIDLRTGDLLVGEAAVEERLVEAGPDVVVAVGSLLLASERDRSRPDIWARPRRSKQIPGTVTRTSTTADGYSTSYQMPPADRTRG